MIKLKDNIGFKENGTIIRNFLKDNLIYNAQTNEIGKIVTFHVTSEQNTSAKGARYFRVKKASTGTDTNWFIDKTKENVPTGELNDKLYLIDDKVKEGLKKLL